MSCEEFEGLSADALGDELSPEDRPRFEEHLASCPRCRREYETSCEAVTTLRDLPGPQRVSVRREGDRLVIQDAADDNAGPRQMKPAAPWRSGIYRYAASVLIAFTAGYIAHAAFAVQEAATSIDSQIVKSLPEPIEVNERQSLEGAIASTYTRSRGRSDLAKALIAMAGH